MRRRNAPDIERRRSKTRSYSVFYEQAPEGGYVAFVPALPGCHTQGETLEDTERNVKEAIALYLESLTAHGEAPAAVGTVVGAVAVGADASWRATAGARRRSGG